jgi:hypothetical protein
MIDRAVESIAFAQHLGDRILESVREPLHLRLERLQLQWQEALSADYRAIEVRPDAMT